MNAAQELIHIVEARGGQLRIHGSYLVVAPEEAALPIMDSLRAHKSAIVALLQSRDQQQVEPELDSDALLSEWMLERCAFRDRSWTAIAALHLDCAQWRANYRRDVCASRGAFVAALETEGFIVTDGWVYGLMLKEDWQAHEDIQAVPEPSKPPARVTTAQRRWSWCSGG